MFVARHGAMPGDSLRRTADTILRDRATFTDLYRSAAQRADRRVFATLVQTYGVLSGYHDEREGPRDRDPD